MSKLRVIAVEASTPVHMEEPELVIACVYKDGKLHVYDTYGSLYHQKEYFADFDSLEFFIRNGRYEWTDIMIDMGEKIYRDFYSNIIVSDHIIDPISPLDKHQGAISSISLRLYHEFLKAVNKNSPELLAQIKQSYKSQEFQEQIELIIKDNPLQNMYTLDKKIIVMSRLFGRDFIIKHVKKWLTSDDAQKNDRCTFFFTRLFKLEQEGYVRID